MAQFYVMNTVRFKSSNGARLVYAGSLVDSTLIDTTALQAAGAVLAAVGDATVATAAALAQKRKKQGAPVHVLDSIMLAAGLKQLGLT